MTYHDDEPRPEDLQRFEQERRALHCWLCQLAPWIKRDDMLPEERSDILIAQTLRHYHEASGHTEAEGHESLDWAFDRDDGLAMLWYCIQTGFRLGRAVQRQEDLDLKAPVVYGN